MDKEKDSSKSDVLVKFVEGQTSKSNPFGDNKVAERAYRRAERIVSAIVLLTNHVESSEPLRIALRTNAFRLLEEILEIREEMRAGNSELIRKLKATIRSLISYVKLLVISGFISVQNGEAVCEGLDDLSSFINAAQRSNLSESIVFTKDELSDTRESSRLLMPAGSSNDVSRPLDSTEVGPGMNGTNQGASKGLVTAPTLAFSSRGQSILEVLADAKREMGIKDIASHLPEYSEKMIQRELADLIDSGHVLKKGLKRWSRYIRAGAAD